MADLEDFVGTYLLQSFVTETTDGTRREPYGPRPCGTLAYLPGGRMIVVFQATERPRTGALEPAHLDREHAATAFFGCTAYAGRYRVEGDRVLHDVETCTFPDWIGTTVERRYRFDGSELLLSGDGRTRSGRPYEMRLAWTRLG